MPMQNATNALSLQIKQSSALPHWLYKAGGIVFASAVAVTFWITFLTVAGSILGHSLETSTLHMIALAITAIVTMALVAMPSVE
jgi:hypothetical protein